MKDTKVKFTIPKGTHKLVKNLDKLEPQTIGCGREIEKLKAEIWNKHYSTQEAFSINIDKLVSLVIISQLIECLTNKMGMSGILNEILDFAPKLGETIMENKKQCNHKKIYAQEILCSIPPQRRWICEICGEEGIDRIGSYDDYIDKFKLIKERFTKSKTQGATPSFNKDYQETSSEVSQIPNGTSDNPDIMFLTSEREVNKANGNEKNDLSR
jgi:hypothetical protein